MKTFVILSVILCLFFQQTFAQKFLMLDSYGLKRTKLYVGNEIIFRTQDTPARYKGTLVELLDSAFYVTGFADSIPIKQIHTFYFQRKLTPTLRTGLNIFAVGFTAVGLLPPLTSTPYYDAKESLIIGISSFTLSQILRLLKWKKFKLKPRVRRARILDLNPPMKQDLYLE